MKVKVIPSEVPKSPLFKGLKAGEIFRFTDSVTVYIKRSESMVFDAVDNMKSRGLTTLRKDGNSPIIPAKEVEIKVKY